MAEIGWQPSAGQIHFHLIYCLTERALVGPGCVKTQDQKSQEGNA